jgi:hydroxyacylglutathione hydrolase
MVYDEALAQAAYIIGCQKTGEAIVFDPERDVDRYIELAKANGLTIVASAETHIHADFLSGVREMAETIGARVYLSKLGGPDWASNWLESKLGGGSYDAVQLGDGDTFTIGNIEFQAIHSPGHTPEHMSYLVTDKGSGADVPMGMITGDFVFVGDLGRPDLLETAAGIQGVKEDSAKLLHASASKFVSDIPEHVQVWPAHGAGSACGKALGAVPQSTAGYEKRFSPALKHVNNQNDFMDFILEGQPEPPLYFARMKLQNRDGVPLLGGIPKPTRKEADAVESLSNDSIVIDTRTTDDFKDGHLPRSINSPLGPMFHTAAGSYVSPMDEISLVVEERDLEQAVRECIRIGLDNLKSFITPDVLKSYAKSGGKLTKITDITPSDLFEKQGMGKTFVLDVRKATEHNESAIKGAFNAAHTRLPSTIDEIPQDREIVVHCKTGVRSVMAASYLLRQGYKPINLVGGFDAWSNSGHTTTSRG